MPLAMTSGNQPPSSSLSKFDAQKAKSTTKKKAVAAKLKANGMRQALRITKKVSMVVINMSVVTAMP